MRLSFRIRWSLYVPPGLTFNNSKLCPHSLFMCFVWIWEQTAIISIYSINPLNAQLNPICHLSALLGAHIILHVSRIRVNWLAFITETECVYCAVRTISMCIIDITPSKPSGHCMYALFNKNQAAWYFVRPAQAVTWGTVAIIIRVVLLSPYLCIRDVSLSPIHYNQSRRVYINQRHQHIRLIWSYNMN
jgi:hypothetical protein